MSSEKIKDVEDVMVAHTNPDFWDFTCKTGIKVQRNNAKDVRYIAFLLTHRGKGKTSAITHIAEVKHTKPNVQRKESHKGFPKLIEYERKRGRDLEGTHKHYVLGELRELPREIPKKKGEQKGQVIFYTTMSELHRAKSVGEIRTLKQLKKMENT